MNHENNNTKWILAALAIVAMTAGIISTGSVAEETVTHPMFVLCTPGDTVNIRHSPSLQSERCGRLELGDRVEVSERRIDRYGRAWYRVEGLTEYGFGWVAGDYLTSREVTTIDRDMVVMSTGRVAVRSGIDGKRQAWVKPGTAVHVLAMSEEWARISTGFIRSEFLQEGK